MEIKPEKNDKNPRGILSQIKWKKYHTQHIARVLFRAADKKLVEPDKLD